MAQRLATPDDWCNLLREFADDKPEFLQVWLDATADAINVSQWKRKASTGHVFLAAHLLTVTTKEGRGERGPANSKAIDKLRVTYAAVGTATQLDANFSTTRYGRAYLALRSTLLVTPIVGRRTLLRPPISGR